MRALIIGGNGFIGTHLTRRVFGLGHAVRVLDVGLRRPELSAMGLEYLQADWSDESTLDAALRDVDAVFHLVSSTVPSSADAAPILDIESNLIGSVRLFQRLIALGKRRVIFLSSGGTVYGNPAMLPVAEEHACRPISSYGIVKFAIESYLEMYRQRGLLDPVIVRAANPFGPLQSSSGGQGVIAAFAKKALEGQPLTVWGDGKQVRDYLYIDDLIDFLVATLHGSEAGVFNVGSGRGYSVLEIIHSLGDAVPGLPPVTFEPARSYDVKALVLDVSRAVATFGWKPRTDLETGLRHTIEWMRSGVLSQRSMSASQQDSRVREG